MRIARLEDSVPSFYRLIENTRMAEATEMHFIRLVVDIRFTDKITCVNTH